MSAVEEPAGAGGRAERRPRLSVRLGRPPRRGGVGRGGGEGVRTRDHLANSRTFLSWMRMALTLVAVGFAVDKFGIIQVHSGGMPATIGHGDRTTAIVLVLAGGILANLAFLRYALQRRIIEGPMLHSRAPLDATLGGLAAVAGVLIVLFLLKTG